MEDVTYSSCGVLLGGEDLFTEGEEAEYYCQGNTVLNYTFEDFSSASSLAILSPAAPPLWAIF